MRFVLEVDCNNAAFGDEEYDELGYKFVGEMNRILINVASRINREEYDGDIRDSNGNKVGRFGLL